MKPATKVVAGPLVDRLRIRHLLDHAAVHDRDAIGHRERLLLVVRYVDEGDPDVALDALELDLELLSQFEVERAQRLVEEQHRRLIHERAREGHALLLAAGQLRGPALGLRGEPHALELLGHAALDLGAVDPLALQAEGHVLLDRAVGEEGIALEDRVGGPLEGGTVGHVLAVEQYAALGGLLEARHHAQGGRLSTPGRAQHREELAPRDVQLHSTDSGELAEAFRHMI